MTVTTLVATPDPQPTWQAVLPMWALDLLNILDPDWRRKYIDATPEEPHPGFAVRLDSLTWHIGRVAADAYVYQPRAARAEQRRADAVGGRPPREHPAGR